MSKLFHENIYYFSDRIDHAMKAIINYPLTIIEAPMGYGKSTAMKEYLKTFEVNDIWINIEYDMVGVFWREFCDVIGRHNKELSELLFHIGFPNDEAACQKILAHLTNTKLKSKTVIVLDGYHTIGSDSINNFIKLLAMKQIPELHVVLMTRFIQMSSMNELIVKGHLHNISKIMFELTAIDVKKYFKLNGISLKDQEVEQLLDITDGWYLGLYLLMLQYKKDEKVEFPNNIFDLIENTVCKKFPVETKEFLQRMSFLNRFTLDQAIQITGNANAEAMLNQIVYENAFVAYDETCKTYYFYQIFSKYLQQCVNRRDAAYQYQHYQKIAEYHFSQGHYLAAMDNYYKIGDFENLLRTIEADKGHCIQVSLQERFINYFDQCPKQIKEKHPIAMLIYAICLFSFNEMEHFYEVCTEFEFIMGSQTNLDEESIAQLNGEYELLLSFTKYNHIGMMLQHIKKAEKLVKRPIEFLDTKSSWTFNSPSVLYMFYRESGKLDEEGQHLTEAIGSYTKLTNGHGTGSESIMAAEIFFNRGDFDSAEILLNKALYPAIRNSQWDIVICARLLSARVAIAKGNYEGVLNSFDQMNKLITCEKWSAFRDVIELCEGFIYSGLKQYDRIPQWIQEGDLVTKKLYFPAQPFYKIIYAKALLIHGDYFKLLGISEELIEEASVFPNVLSLIYTHIYIAVANHQIHRFKEATQSLRCALNYAVPDQVFMPFVENFDWIQTLLEEVSTENKYKKDIVTIFTLSESYTLATESIKKEYFTGNKPQLTEREREIAELASGGLTNKEIGEKLFISTNTVKMALKSVFVKLSINNRALLKQYL